MKDFDHWNIVKKQTEERVRAPFAYPREIWWASLGVNVGIETDGKNENFERPVLVLRVYNKGSILVLPITSKEKHDKFHFRLEIAKSKFVFVKLTQVRVISTKRLLRKVDVISEDIFNRIKNDLKKFL